MALDFLRYRKIKLVNIRSEDVVDGNHKYDIIMTILKHLDKG